MLKKLCELTTAEVKNLLSNNKFLRETAEENAQEDAWFMLNEYVLAPFSRMRGIDYNIGYPGNHFTVKESNFADFLTACMDHDEKESIFGDILPEIARAAARADFFEEVYNGYIEMTDKKYADFEEWMREKVSKATRAIVKRCIEEVDYSYTEEAIETAAEMFCEFRDDLLTDGEKIMENAPRIFA